MVFFFTVLVHIGSLACYGLSPQCLKLCSHFFNLDAFIHNFYLTISLESDYLSDFIFSVTSNNAGIMASPFMLSKDNIELQFATNHLGSLHLHML